MFNAIPTLWGFLIEIITVDILINFRREDSIDQVYAILCGRNNIYPHISYRNSFGLYLYLSSNFIFIFILILFDFIL